MPIKPTTDEELLASLEKAHAEDVLTLAYSSEEVVASIRADGGAPESIGQRGVELVKQLLDKRRLGWQEVARQKLRATGPLLIDKTKPARGSVPREVLLSKVGLARQHTVTGASVNAMFRNRSAEETSDEELQGMLEDIEDLKQLEQAARTDKKDK